MSRNKRITGTYIELVDEYNSISNKERRKDLKSHAKEWYPHEFCDEDFIYLIDREKKKKDKE